MGKLQNTLTPVQCLDAWHEHELCQLRAKERAGSKVDRLRKALEHEYAAHRSKLGP